jgi:hypothetical protein
MQKYRNYHNVMRIDVFTVVRKYILVFWAVTCVVL